MGDNGSGCWRNARASNRSAMYVPAGVCAVWRLCGVCVVTGGCLPACSHTGEHTGEHGAPNSYIYARKGDRVRTTIIINTERAKIKRALHAHASKNLVTSVCVCVCLIVWLACVQAVRVCVSARLTVCLDQKSACLAYRPCIFLDTTIFSGAFC